MFAIESNQSSTDVPNTDLLEQIMGGTFEGCDFDFDDVVLEGNNVSVGKRSRPTDTEGELNEPIDKQQMVESDNVAREFDENIHEFQFELSNSYVIFENVVRLMLEKKDSTLTLLVSDNGVRLTTFCSENSIFIDTFINRKICGIYDKPKDAYGDRVCVISTYDLDSHLKRLSKMNSIAIVVRGIDGEIEISGIREDQEPMCVQIRELGEDPNDLIFPINTYDTTFQVGASIFCTSIAQMIGELFSLEITGNQMILSSSEDNCSIRLPIALGDNTVSDYMKANGIDTFKKVYNKKYFDSVRKGSKINEMIRISLSEDAPLKIQYMIGDSLDVENLSMVNIYIADHVAEDD
jgi:hypothetical protein